MSELLALAAGNLLSPPVLFFVLGLAAGLLRSDLSIPDALGRGLALYLMLAIGFKGGSAMVGQPLGGALLAALLAGALLSALLPLLAFAWLRASSALSRLDSGAVAAHYGSISLVTFVTAGEALAAQGVSAEGYMVAVAAVMETPAIGVGLWLAGRTASTAGRGADASRGDLLREVLLNGSVVLLVGAFLIGWASGARGEAMMAPFVKSPFTGVLCLFLLEMGLVTAHRLLDPRGRGALSAPVLAFGLLMPPTGALFGLLAGWLCGLSTGGVTLFAVLAGSASYIAVPAALRIALPRADPALPLLLSLGVTFPFNLVIGIPLYHHLARLLTG